MLLPILAVLLVLLLASLRIAQEYQRAIVFRLGRY
ncbi:MAG: slipin family protein, partial [Hymenobacter sp.]